MSNTGDERWRTVQKQRNAQDQSQSQSQPPNPHQSRQPNQHRPSSSRDNGVAGQSQRTRDSGTQGFTTMSGNAWNNDRGLRESSQYGPTQDQHVPVNGFNAADARDTLKNGPSSTEFEGSNEKLF
ncbi:MAG: hypothetical protein Q9212_000988 [Teloschistes hypoglaucus]